MTPAELIALLQKMPPDQPVVFKHGDEYLEVAILQNHLQASIVTLWPCE